jgi:hypothetical protein
MSMILGQDKNDDAIGNRYADAIAVAVGQEAKLIVGLGHGKISFR